MFVKLSKIDTGKKYLIVATLFISVAILLSFKFYGYENTWHLWNIETLMPPFSDLRLIPGSAETFQRGIDPAVRNPGDPYKRIFNYPRIWYLFFYTGISQDDVIGYGIFLLFLAYLGMISFPKKLNKQGVFLMVMVVFSPAAMLLYERGNVDLIIFFICALALVFLDISAFVTAGVLLFGALLKVFPLFGLVIFLQKGWKTFWRSAFFVIFGFLIYFSLTFSSMATAWESTMRGIRLSYGANVVFARYQKMIVAFLENGNLYPEFEKVLNLLPYLLGIFIVLIVVLKSMRDNPVFSTPNEKNLAAFQMGAFIYIGTFLLGNNWDYRLIFLVFTLPQLADWLCSSKGREYFVVLSTILLIIISTWHFWIVEWFSWIFANPDVGTLFDEAVNWLLFGILTYIGYASFPSWFKDFFRELKILKWVTE